MKKIAIIAILIFTLGICATAQDSYIGINSIKHNDDEFTVDYEISDNGTAIFVGIDENGRLLYVKSDNSGEIPLPDRGKTLKVFLWSDLNGAIWEKSPKQFNLYG